MDDVGPHIAAAYCVVLPSYRECEPRTLFEAATMTCPLIATDVPDFRSVLDDGTRDLLCEVRSGESLAAACPHSCAFIQKPNCYGGVQDAQKMAAAIYQARVVRAYCGAIASAIACHGIPQTA